MSQVAISLLSIANNIEPRVSARGGDQLYAFILLLGAFVAILNLPLTVYTFFITSDNELNVE